MFGQQGDDAAVGENHKTLEAKLQGYEIILGRQKYLGGDVSRPRGFVAVLPMNYEQEVTLADLFHLPYGWLLSENAGNQLLKSDKLPNVKRWTMFLTLVFFQVNDFVDGGRISLLEILGRLSRLTSPCEQVRLHPYAIHQYFYPFVTLCRNITQL